MSCLVYTREHPRKAFHARFLVSAALIVSSAGEVNKVPCRRQEKTSGIQGTLTVDNKKLPFFDGFDPPMARLAYYNCGDTWLHIGKSCVLLEVVQ